MESVGLRTQLTDTSLAWAELYMATAAIVQRFDFKLEGAGPKDVECVSDQFIIGTKDQNGVKARVSNYNG